MSDQQSNEQSGQQGSEHQIKDVTPAEGNDVRKVRPTLTDFAILAAEVGFALWMIDDLLRDITRPWWQKALLLVGVALILFAVAHKILEKIWPKKGTVCVIYCVVIAVLTCAVFRHPPEKTEVPVVERQEDTYSGVLEPKNDALPFPPDFSISSFPSNSVFLFAGSCVIALGPARASHAICVFSYNGDCLLTIEEERATAFISGRFFDEDGKLLAELISNRFDVARPPVTFRAYRPNGSTLIVRDNRGKEVLNLKYLNRSAFEMTGVFRLPDRRKVTMTSDALRLPNGNEVRGDAIGATETAGAGRCLDFLGPPAP